MPKSTKDVEYKIRLARNIEWQNSLDGFTDAALKPLLKATTQAQREITARLEHWAGSPTPTGFSEDRANALVDELGRLTTGIQAHLTGSIGEMAGHVGSASLATHGDILSWGGKAVPFNAVALSPEQVRQLAMTTPVGGRLLEDWVGRTFDSNLISGIKHEMTVGMLKGSSYPDLVGRISDGWDMTRTQAVTLARTYVQSANVGAQEKVYSENQDIVKGVIWCATLEIGGKKGGGTCLQCAVLDGTEYSWDEKRPDCPLHPRCRCILVPWTKTWRELGLDVDEMNKVYRPYTQSDLDIYAGRSGQVDMQGFHQGSFSDLYPKLPKEQQIAVVGPGRWGLIQNGEVTFDDLIDKATGELRLLEKGPDGQWVGLKPPRGGGGLGDLDMGGVGEVEKWPLFNDLLPEKFDEVRAKWTTENLFNQIRHEDYANEEDFYIKIFGSREEAVRRANMIADEGSVYMSIDSGTLRNKIIKGDGSFKNSMETGKGTFKTIGEDRAIKEREIFGITAKYEEFDKWPKYGFVSSEETMGHEKIVGWGYGDLFVKFKNNAVKGRTTLTFGDSYDTNVFRTDTMKALKLAPSTKMSAMDEKFFWGNSRFSPESGWMGRLKAATTVDETAAVANGYIEAQIYGRVTMEDVESIFISSRKKAEAIVKDLAKAGYNNIEVKPLAYDERLKMLWEGEYSAPAMRLRASLTPDDIDRLGDPWMDKLSKDWMGHCVSVYKNTRPGGMGGGGNTFWEIPDELKSGVKKYSEGTLTSDEKREWLKLFYDRIKLKEKSGLPKTWWEDYRPKLGGFTEDIYNTKLLERYE